MATKHEKQLLDANPWAKRDEKLIRQALRDIAYLREAGIAGHGYSLLPPFGEKGHVIPKRVESSENKLTDNA